jgi:hypothetical protein
MNNLVELKTKPTLLHALKNTSSRRLSADEVHQQRVSFIFGSIKRASGVTKSQIEEVLAGLEGNVSK